MRKSAFIATLVAACLLPAGATHAQDPSPVPIHPIAPRQFFNGLVNGNARESRIALVCPSPATSRTGHPVPGQSVNVHQLFPPSIDRGLGFTGGASTIAATLRLISPSSAAGAPAPIALAVFSLYDVRVAIPTTLNLPCGGAGAVTFDPVQGGDAAQSYTTRVKFVSISAGT
jgi:hypothetical protein